MTFDIFMREKGARIESKEYKRRPIELNNNFLNLISVCKNSM